MEDMCIQPHSTCPTIDDDYVMMNWRSIRETTKNNANTDTSNDTSNVNILSDDQLSGGILIDYKIYGSTMEDAHKQSSDAQSTPDDYDIIMNWLTSEGPIENDIDDDTLDDNICQDDRITNSTSSDDYELSDYELFVNSIPKHKFEPMSVTEFKFYHQNFLTQGDVRITHYINKGYKKNYGFGFKTYDEYVQSGFVEGLMRAAGDQFNLNEHTGAIPSRFFIDIDIPLSDVIIHDIIDVLGKLIENPDILVLQNTVSKKIHIIMNVTSNPIKSEHRFILLNEIRSYIRNNSIEVGLGIPESKWCDAIDIGCDQNFRAAYGQAIYNGIHKKPGIYIPFGEQPKKSIEERAKTVYEYSVYRPATSTWKEEFIIRLELAVKQSETECAVKLIKAQESLKDQLITPEEINTLLRRLPRHYLDGKSWKFLLRKMKHINTVYPVDVNYFLHIWSAEGQDYNKQGNDDNWRRIKGNESKATESLCWLRDACPKNDKNEIFNIKGLIDIISSTEDPSKKSYKSNINAYIKDFINGDFAGQREEINKSTLPTIKSLYSDCNALLIKSAMGTGKSKAIREYIKEIGPLNIVFVSFRRSFTSDLISKLDGFVDYRDVKTHSISSRRVVIQYESLHRLEIHRTEPYLLILDESESISTQMDHICHSKDIHESPYIQCWNNLQLLITSSEQIIALDALMARKTFTLLERRKCKLVTNTYKLGHKDSDNIIVGNTEKDYYYGKCITWGQELYDRVPNCINEPIVIIVTRKKLSKELYTYCRESAPFGAVIKLYNSDSTIEQRKDFENFSEVMDKTHILIYTATITAGISYENDHFVHRFARFDPYRCDVVQAIQMMGRIRNIKSSVNHIHIEYKGIREYAPQTFKEVSSVVSKMASMNKMRAVDNVLDKYKSYLHDLSELNIDLGTTSLFRQHCENILAKNRSDKYFIALFALYRVRAGLQLMGINYKEEAITGSTQTEQKKLNQIAMEIKEAHDVGLLLTKSIDEYKFNKIQENGPQTEDERLEVEKYILEQTYNIGSNVEVLMDMKFIKKYNIPRVKKLWKNLKRMEGIDGLREQMNRFLTRSNNQEDKPMEIEEIKKYENIMKLTLGIDVLVRLLGEEMVEGIEFDKRFGDHREIRYVSGVHLDNTLPQTVEYILSNSKMFDKIFDIRTTKNTSDRTTRRNQLFLVNTILSCSLDVKILCYKNEKNMYYFKPSERFAHIPEIGRWLPTCAYKKATPGFTDSTPQTVANEDNTAPMSYKDAARQMYRREYKPAERPIKCEEAHIEEPNIHDGLSIEVLNI